VTRTFRRYQICITDTLEPDADAAVLAYVRVNGSTAARVATALGLDALARKLGYELRSTDSRPLRSRTRPTTS
jgi:hypothetical protein